MSYRILSFLGTTKYVEAYYVYNNKKSHAAYQFIQEALLEFFCKNWKEDDQIIIFLTEEARKKNWLSKNEYEGANFEKGLKERLEETKKRLKLSIKVKECEIPEGRNEKEIWEIFEKINDSIDEESSLIFDITHSFRYLPMLTFISLNYVKFLKNVKIDQIIYGAMEALGSANEVKELPLERRVIPIFNLTPFAGLFNWTIAVERFLQTGNAEMISKQGLDDLKPLLKETKGKIGQSLRKLITSLNSFSQDVMTCRYRNFRSDIINISEKLLPEAEKELEQLKPFKPLFGKIKEIFNSMKTTDDVSCGLEVSSWCLRNNLIQQGFTILRETIVNHVIATVLDNKDFDKMDNREKAEDMLNKRCEKIPTQILNLWHEIIEYRNDINHCGLGIQNYHSPNDFKKKLAEYIERFRLILQDEASKNL